jgi:hypothetical protein
VEELRALRAWRKEIYGSGLRPAGQAARYWHAELERVVHSATSRYAAGCRAGHRRATRPVAADGGLLESWAAASPDAGVPEADLGAAAARAAGGWVPAEDMAAAIDAGEAVAMPDPHDYVAYRGGWWRPASGGWFQDLARTRVPAQADTPGPREGGEPGGRNEP